MSCQIESCLEFKEQDGGARFVHNYCRSEDEKKWEMKRRETAKKDAAFTITYAGTY